MHTAGISEQFRVWGLGCLDPCYVLSTDADRHKWRGGEGRLGYMLLGGNVCLACLRTSMGTSTHSTNTACPQVNRRGAKQDAPAPG